MSQVTENYTQEEIVQAVYDYAASELMAGKSREQVESALVEKGMDAEDARLVLTHVSQAIAKGHRKGGWKNMIVGALCCGVGIAITAATYTAAAEGETYVVAYGAIIFGGIQSLMGLGQVICGPLDHETEPAC